MGEPFVMEGWEFSIGTSGHWIAEKDGVCASIIGDCVMTTSLVDGPNHEPSEAVVDMLLKMEGVVNVH